MIFTPKGNAFVGDQMKPDAPSIGEAERNAELAAAAPDLAAALKSLFDAVIETGNGSVIDLQNVRAVLARVGL